MSEIYNTGSRAFARITDMKKMLFVIALFLAASAGAAELPSWMAGAWTTTLDGAQVEERWTDARGNLMIGMNRTVYPNGKTSFEFLRIELRDGKPVYLAMPGGRSPATAFPMKSQTASRIVFENLGHDFPQRVLYWRDGEKLCGRVEGTMDGKAAGEEWCWARAEESSSAVTRRCLRGRDR